jgi:hypothetical protein
MQPKSRKERLTITVGRSLLRAAREAVAAGRAECVSGWVNRALEDRAAKERRLVALADAVAAYEAEAGEITPEEMLAQERDDRRSARVVRGRP